MSDWVQHGEELRKGGRWYCEKCLREHDIDFRIIRIIKGKNYQIWKGPHMIGSCASAKECKVFVDEFNLGELF